MRNLKSKGRTNLTNHNKLRKLRSFYRRLFKHSQEQKKRNEEKNYKIVKKYFCDKYPSEKSFLDKVKIKSASPAKGKNEIKTLKKS